MSVTVVIIAVGLILGISGFVLYYLGLRYQSKEQNKGPKVYGTTGDLIIQPVPMRYEDTRQVDSYQVTSSPCIDPVTAQAEEAP